MMTYCPSCGMNQPSEEKVVGGVRQWSCASCSLVLKEEPAGPAEPVLGRVPVAKMTQSQLATARAAADRAAEKAAAEKATAERAAAERAAAQARQAEPQARAPLEIDLGQDAADDFQIEIGGQERVVSATAHLAPVQVEAEVDFAAPAAVAARAPAPAASGRAGFENVVVAEDSALLREVLKDALEQAGVCSAVRSCSNGAELLQAIFGAVAQRQAVDLAVLDVDMPLLNGYYAAIALRAVEKGLGTRPTPIVFFTAYPCDDTFKKVLEHCQPARYLNKGADASPPQIAARLVQVLASLRR